MEGKKENPQINSQNFQSPQQSSQNDQSSNEVGSKPDQQVKPVAKAMPEIQKALSNEIKDINLENIGKNDPDKDRVKVASKQPPETENPETKEAERSLVKKLKPYERGSIRTYAGDIAGLLRKGASLSQIALSEQRRKLSNSGSKPNGTPSKVKQGGSNKVIFFIIFFIILGALSVAITFIFSNKKEEGGVALISPTIIFSNNHIEVVVDDLNKADFFKKLNEGRISAEGTLGSITNIYLTTGNPSKRQISSQELFEKMNVEASGSFVRSLGKEFMFGSHIFDGNQGFLLFKVNSFSNALAGALNWERVMFDDLWRIFYETKPLIGLSTTATSSPEDSQPTESLPVVQEKFKDRIIRNRDVRVLENNGEIILLYSFPDKDHLIITSDQSTFIEILDRLTTDRFRN